VVRWEAVLRCLDAVRPENKPQVTGGTEPNRDGTNRQLKGILPGRGRRFPATPPGKNQARTEALACFRPLSSMPSINRMRLLRGEGIKVFSDVMLNSVLYRSAMS
jgi:hypothetical protein